MPETNSINMLNIFPLKRLQLPAPVYLWRKHVIFDNYTQFTITIAGNRLDSKPVQFSPQWAFFGKITLELSRETFPPHPRNTVFIIEWNYRHKLCCTRELHQFPNKLVNMMINIFNDSQDVEQFTWSPNMHSVKFHLLL